MNEDTILESLGVSRETEDRLTDFRKLFEKWAKSINLVAPSTLGDMWHRHVLDSAQIYRLNRGAHVWADLGSGGGFPGIITAILMREAGSGHVHLVESNKKKCAFLRVAAQELDLHATVHPIRIETAPEVIGAVDVISARALAELDTLLGLSEPWFAMNGKLRAFFNKGRDYSREISKADSRWNFDLLKHQSVIQDDSVILEIANLARK